MADLNSLIELFKRNFQSTPPPPVQSQLNPQLPAMLTQAPAGVQDWGQKLSALYPGPPNEQELLQGLKDMTDPKKSEIYRKFTELISKLKR